MPFLDTFEIEGLSITGKKEGLALGKEQERARVKVAVEAMIAATQKAIDEEAGPFMVAECLSARRDGLVELLRWLQEAP